MESDPDDIYTTDVVNRVLDWQRNIASEPEFHEHAQDEMGMCIECDAAFVVAAIAAVTGEQA